MIKIDLDKISKNELATILVEKDKEIERLNTELELYEDNHEHLNTLLEQKDNIINELEKWIEKNKQFQLISERCIVWEDKLIDKLQELKGSE